MDYLVLLDLGLILIVAKALGLLARHIHIPQVVGEIVAGLILGPNILGIVKPNEFIIEMAELGVIFIMFVAGLETDLKEIKKTGLMSLAIASMGVLVPLILGFVLFSCFYGFGSFGTVQFIEAAFIGTIITATSVGITVEVLRELGHLKTKVGTVILSAAIIDDVIGIVLLTVVSGMKNSESGILSVLLRTVLFFLFSGVVGFVGYHFFKWLDRIRPHQRRISIFSVGFCLIMSYVAESVFGIADITGAFVAGIILCNIKDAEYIARRVDINSYMVFSPIFFASIGIKITVSGLDSTVLLFSICFVIVAMLAKIIGCGAMAKICRFSTADSIKIGVGMMARGEVALIVAQKGISEGVIQPVFLAAVVLLIMVSSIFTPIMLKFLYRNSENKVQ